jgi:predicted nucleotidyltransferase
MKHDLMDLAELCVVAGSRCYGIHTETSDVDVKGVLTVPREIALGFQGKIEQVDSPSHMECFIPFLDAEQRAAVDREKIEGVLYELRKFMKLAADCNPNILDVLFCRDEEVIYTTEIGRKLRENRHLFISAKAKHTFTGYAAGQLKRIKGHRAWLLNPPTKAPTREEFGLGDNTLTDNQRNVVLAAIKMRLDTWSWDFDDMAHSDILRVREGLEETLVDMGIASEDDRFMAAGRSLGINDGLMEALKGEKKYRDAKKQWKQYLTWKRERNERRAALEAEHGYDTKHAAHLVRLLRMGREVLETGEVNVWRGDIDAQELLAIRRGAWTYEQLVEWAESEKATVDALYNSRNYAVPHGPDFKALNALCVELMESTL